ncbi:MAG: selenocysteine-specific translation elongation factor [Planctomycetota bacterium]
MATPHQSLILGTAGHIDHGKTSLVKALTGIDTDQLPAEKQRGITIDLGFAQLQCPIQQTRISIVDVPGHERFIRNMLAGATGFDMALLVIAADDGVMPQTLEHLEILSLLGLKLGLIALTKCDLVPTDWQEMVIADIRQRIAQTFLANAPIIKVSNSNGDGVDQIRNHIFQIANGFHRQYRQFPFRLSVDRVFHRPGHGVIATGSVNSGSITTGTQVLIWPSGEPARIRSMQSHGEIIESAETGMRLAINLAGVRLDDLKRGAELASTNFLAPSQWLGIRLKTLDNALHPIKNRADYRLHTGTCEVSATIVLANGSEIPPGNSGLALIRTREPITAIHGQPYVLRTESPPATIAGGRILAPNARLIRRKEQNAWLQLDQLDSPSCPTRLAAWMSLNRQHAPDANTAAREIGMTPGESLSALETLRSSGQIMELCVNQQGRRWEISAGHFEALLDRITRRLSRFHQDSPRLTGIPATNLAGRFPDQSPELIMALIQHPLAKKRINLSGTMVSMAGFNPQLTQTERKLRQTLLEGLIKGQATPPLLDEWSKTTGTKPALLIDIFQILISEGLVKEFGHGLFVTTQVATQTIERVQAWFSNHESLTVAELRDLLEVSRKYAVPIAEWLDLMKITRRDGDLRYPVS